MSDIYDAHKANKDTNAQLKAALSRLDDVPADPPVNGTGDAYYAKYWGEFNLTLATRLDVALGEEGYPK